jgi:FRG domain-containing protein
MVMEKGSSITEIRINSLGDLIDAVTPAEPDAKTGRRRDVGIYRGMNDPDWPLLTSLDQLGGVKPPHMKADVEEHVLRNFIRYSRPYLATASVNEWELLVLAQHHGLPTRLLDWSYSPLVAAHFATVNGKLASDRVVWRLDWQTVHRRFGLPELALLIEDMQKLFGEDEPFTPWKLMRAGAARDFACMIEPPSLDSRIESQSAVFSLCSDKRRSLAEFLADHDLADALTRFIIPAAEVARVRDQLDLVGMDERLIFPDLDGVAAKIRRYYS